MLANSSSFISNSKYTLTLFQREIGRKLILQILKCIRHSALLLSIKGIDHSEIKRNTLLSLTHNVIV